MRNEFSVVRWLSLLLLLGFASIAVPASASNVEVGKVIAKLFSDSEAKTGVAQVDTNYDRVRSFYESRTFKPVWTRDSGPKGKGKSLLKELKRSSVHGLTPEFYNVPQIEALMDATDPEKIAELDILLSGAMIAFADDLANGHVGPQNPDSANAVSRVLMSADQIISDAADAGDFRNFAKDFLRVDDRYFRLLAKITEFDRIEEARMWPSIDANGKPIEVGSSDPRMKDVRMILVLSGVLAPDPAADELAHNDQTANAIRRFQRQNGIKPDGTINQETLSAMAVSTSARKRQILLNLERRRWQNRELGPDHIYVNLADNSARIVRNGKKQANIQIEARGRSQALPTFYGEIAGFLVGQGGGSNVRLLMNAKHLEFPIDDQAAGLFIGSNDLKTLGNLIGNFDLVNAKPGDRVDLEKPLELFVTYVTVWANKDGTINYRPDKYNRDQALSRLLSIK